MKKQRGILKRGRSGASGEIQKKTREPVPRNGADITVSVVFKETAGDMAGKSAKRNIRLKGNFFRLHGTLR